VRLTGRAGRETFEIAVPLVVADRSNDHEAVAKLWARRAIRDVEWYPGSLDAGGVRAKVTSIAMQHHLVSRYTSLVAIDDERSACGPVEVSLRVPHEAPRGAPGAAGVSGYGSGGGYGGAAAGGTAYYARQGASLPMNFMVSQGPAVASSESRIVPAPRGAVRRLEMDAAPMDAPSEEDDDLFRVVRKNQSQLRQVYEQALKRNPATAGRVELRVVVENGKVTGVEVVSNGTGDAEFADALVKKVRRWSFPAAASGEILFPILFRPNLKTP
jgi:TonB family protein